MKYELFIKLYLEAKEYNDMDIYIAERGWEDWMDECDTDKSIEYMDTVFKLAKMNLREMREEILKISRNEMSRKYMIPSRTLQDWEYGNNAPTNYVESALVYCIFYTAMEAENGSVKK